MLRKLKIYTFSNKLKCCSEGIAAIYRHNFLLILLVVVSPSGSYSKDITTDVNFTGQERLIRSWSHSRYFAEFRVVHAFVWSLCLYRCNYVSGLFLYYLTFLLIWVPYSKLSRRHEINQKNPRVSCVHASVWSRSCVSWIYIYTIVAKTVSSISADGEVNSS